MSEQNEASRRTSGSPPGDGPEPDRSHGVVKKYDFRRPDKFSLEQITVFGKVHETLARGLVLPIATGTGLPTQVRVHGVDQMTYAEFVESVADASLFAEVAFTPLAGSVVVQIDPSLAALLARTACGAPPVVPVAAAERTMTEIESIILREVVVGFLPAVSEAWHDIVHLNLEVRSLTATRNDAAVVPPSEMIILAELEVTTGDLAAIVNVAVPYATIEPLLERLTVRYWYGRRNGAGVSPASAGRTGHLPVACEVAIPVDGVRVGDLNLILNGDPLALPSLDRERAALHAGGVPVATLAMGVRELAGEDVELGVVAASTAPDPPSATRIADDDAGGALAVQRTLEPLLHDLAAGVGELRLAVAELREDRDSLIADAEGESALGADVASYDVDSPEELARLIADETPATVAFILAPMADRDAARILTALGGRARDEAVRAMVDLENGNLALHRRVLGFIRRRIRTIRDTSVTGGAAVVARILNHVPASVEKSVMERLKAEERPVFDSIAQLMFVFEDFVIVEPDAVRKVAARFEPEEIALAFKGVPREVRDHLTGALDEERVSQLEEAERKLGRVRRSDVEAMQREMIEELRRLDQAGEVVVARPEDVVE